MERGEFTLSFKALAASNASSIRPTSKDIKNFDLQSDRNSRAICAHPNTRETIQAFTKRPLKQHSPHPGTKVQKSSIHSSSHTRQLRQQDQVPEHAKQHCPQNGREQCRTNEDSSEIHESNKIATATAAAPTRESQQYPRYQCVLTSEYPFSFK